jgi:L-iditol 2-dehydrogenase
VMDLTRGRGADIVFDAAAAVETINQGIGAVRPAGRLVLIGIPTELNMNIDLHTAMTKEVSIQTIKRSNHNDAQALALIAAGKVPDSFVTHHLALEQTPDAFQMLTDYTDQVGKVIIQL